MKEFNEDFIKDTAQQFADSQQFEIDHKYDFKSVETGYVEGFKKALELVKNNGVLDDVSQQRELLKAFLEWQQNKYSMPYDTKIDWQIKDFEAFNCG